MAEVKTPVETFRVSYKCDSCESGNMQICGPKVQNESGDIVYPHKCSDCEAEKDLFKSYPYNVTE
jgi:hypothetical protein